MKVLLLSANTLAAPYPVYPLGLDFVAAALAPDHAVRIADLNALEPGETLEPLLREFAPDLVGLALRNVDNTDTTAPEGFVGRYRETVAAVRRWSDAPVVLGGSGFTIFPRELMAALDADYGIVGEGERLRDLADALESGERAEGLPGVLARTRASDRASGPEADTGADTERGADVRGGPEDISPGPWSGRFHPEFPGRRPHLDFYLRRGGMLNLQTQRGCPFRCVYCTYPHIEGRRPRFLPAADVARTALRLRDAGAKYLFVTDSAFNADPDHARAVARAFREVELAVPWGAFFAPTPPPPGFFREMAEAGLTHVEFGTESLSDPVLRAYGKPFRAAGVIEAHRAARAAGLHVAHYFLLGGPGENRETLEQTLSNIDKLEKTVLFFFCGMRIYPHTPLYDIAAAEGQVEPGRSLLEPVFYRSPAISSEEIVRRVSERAAGRPNWVVGSGGAEMEAVLARMYARGFSGPLWEYLVR
jgi:radical SAM superfamily enzyme YgiQ (UPF0313 family)